jgi:hypothetical protein
MPPGPDGQSTYAVWVRERAAGASGTWHRPVSWPPLVAGDPVATACGRDVPIAYSANIGAGGRPHPACPVCAP